MGLRYDDQEIRCSNDPCRNRATKFFVAADGKDIVPLCDTCGDAYEIAASEGTPPLRDLYNVPDDVQVCPECQRGFLSQAAGNPNNKYCGACGSTFTPAELEQYQDEEDSDGDGTAD